MNNLASIAEVVSTLNVSTLSYSKNLIEKITPFLAYFYASQYLSKTTQKKILEKC